MRAPGWNRPAERGGLRAAFVFWLLVLGSCVALAAPTPAHLKAAADPIWLALLHHAHGRYTLADTGLLLTKGGSPAEELQASLAAMTADPGFQCRYPARAAFLRSRFEGLSAAPADCPELDEYLRRAPADRISLVFVAENLEQPSSVMGHLLIKVSGVDAEGELREHAISFYTDSVGINFPFYMYQGMVSGMPGYFSLTPYRDLIATHVHHERRALWEYELQLDASERERLRLHVLELKSGRYSYLFASYNCATIILELLAVARPEVLDQRFSWVTPKEVVRIAARHGVVGATQAVFPAETARALYAPALHEAERQQVRRALLEGRHDEKAWEVAPQRRALANNLALAESEVLQRRGRLSADKAAAWREAFLARDPDLSIGFDASSRYNPANSGGDLRVSVGLRQQRGGATLLELRWLPVSHHLGDDNRNYLHESELRLFEAAFSSTKSEPVRVERLTLFSALSLPPWEDWGSPLSSSFSLQWRRSADGDLAERAAFETAIGRGLTARIHPDVDLFAMGVAVARIGSRSRLTLEPEAGLVMRLAWDLKWVSTWRGAGTGRRAEVHDHMLAWHLDRHRSLKLGLREERGRAARRQSAGIELMQVF